MHPRWPPAEQKEFWSSAINLHRDIAALLFESMSWFILVGKLTPYFLVIIEVSVKEHWKHAKTEL